MWGKGELSLWWMVVGGVWLWEEKLLLLLLPILLPIFIIGNGAIGARYLRRDCPFEKHLVRLVGWVGGY